MNLEVGLRRVPVAAFDKGALLCPLGSNLNLLLRNERAQKHGLPPRPVWRCPRKRSPETAVYTPAYPELGRPSIVKVNPVFFEGLQHHIEMPQSLTSKEPLVIFRRLR